eukprot:7672931-Pyramimonas_sp.AAC.1
MKRHAEVRQPSRTRAVARLAYYRQALELIGRLHLPTSHVVKGSSSNNTSEATTTPAATYPMSKASAPTTYRESRCTVNMIKGGTWLPHCISVTNDSVFEIRPSVTTGGGFYIALAG